MTKPKRTFEVEYTATLCGKVRILATDVDDAQKRVLGLSDEVLGDPKRRVHMSLAVAAVRTVPEEPDVPP